MKRHDCNTTTTDTIFLYVYQFVIEEFVLLRYCRLWWIFSSFMPAPVKNLLSLPSLWIWDQSIHLRLAGTTRRIANSWVWMKRAVACVGDAMRQMASEASTANDVSVRRCSCLAMSTPRPLFPVNNLVMLTGYIDIIALSLNNKLNTYQMCYVTGHSSSRIVVQIYYVNIYCGWNIPKCFSYTQCMRTWALYAD